MLKESTVSKPRYVEKKKREREKEREIIQTNIGISLKSGSKTFFSLLFIFSTLFWKFRPTYEIHL
jgi:hypothetical protein